MNCSPNRSRYSARQRKKNAIIHRHGGLSRKEWHTKFLLLRKRGDDAFWEFLAKDVMQSKKLVVSSPDEKLRGSKNRERTLQRLINVVKSEMKNLRLDFVGHIGLHSLTMLLGIDNRHNNLQKSQQQ